ncbi:glycosyltransferase family 2 protein [Leptolyngbya sp. KIOST-1]|uniref:glycosyltransferase family 2 protein n=1 Tax=Leptolyngbya sp. KIOST-1 TaxID=1229172 RepID=UPI00068A3E7D|nr:glycosyltransferase [Leptolyngbya sp. KIOST-1]
MMNQEPLISVVIPTFNRAYFLNKAIQSVLAQSYKNYEIIVVDDNSSDQTEEVVGQVKYPNFFYKKHSKNMGGGAARNSGIDMAKGDFIAFLDSDDIWLPKKLEIQIGKILKSKKPLETLSYTQRSMQNTFSGHIMPVFSKDPEVSVADYLFAKRPDVSLKAFLVSERGDMQSSTLMLSSQLAKKVRFCDDLKKHQDWDFCLRLDLAGADFLFVDEPLTLWGNSLEANKVSKISDYKISLQWINTYKGKISPQAFLGFMLIEVLPKMFMQRENKIFAQTVIFRSLIRRIINYQEFQLLTDKNIHYKKRIRNLFLANDSTPN